LRIINKECKTRKQNKKIKIRHFIELAFKIGIGLKHGFALSLSTLEALDVSLYTEKAIETDRYSESYSDTKMGWYFASQG